MEAAEAVGTTPRKEKGPAPPQRAIAQILVAVRLHYGLGQTALASRIGCHQSNVSGWESGVASVSESTLDKYAHGLGIAVIELLRIGLDEQLLRALPDDLREALRPLLESLRGDPDEGRVRQTLALLNASVKDTQ